MSIFNKVKSFFFSRKPTLVEEMKVIIEEEKTAPVKKRLSQGRKMTALIELQKKCGVTADGVWGPTTFKAACAYFNLNPIQGAHVFGNCYHETGGFRLFEENLNYSAEGLQKIFKKYFPTLESTNGYARNPSKIANKVYANRMGNGNEISGDGWKYRGRGALQLTGKENYTLLSQAINKPEIISNPELVTELYAFESAIWFFNKNKLLPLCKDISDANITLIRKKVNGGTIGLDDVLIQVKKFASWK